MKFNDYVHLVVLDENGPIKTGERSTYHGKRMRFVCNAAQSKRPTRYTDLAEAATCPDCLLDTLPQEEPEPEVVEATPEVAEPEPVAVEPKPESKPDL